MNAITGKSYDANKNESEVADLIWKSQAGEMRALEELLRIYEKLILRISKRYYFQDGETDDVIQECRIAFWHSVMNYKNSKSSVSLESFAYICINRRLASALRKRSKGSTRLHNNAMAGKATLDKDRYTLTTDLIVGKEDLEEEYIFRETREKYLENIRNNISEQCGAIVKLREEGYSYKEIGEKLEITTKKVDNSMRKIKRNITPDDIYN